jgi:nicotinamide-nucleotide amidase
MKKLGGIVENSGDFFKETGYYPKDTIENLDKTVTNVVKLLLLQNKTVSTAESCTGGMLSQLITSVPDSSKVFELGICSYANRIKTEILGVPADILDNYGAVSPQTALLMAQGIRKKANFDFAVSVTGIAGPGGGTAEKPVGTVYTAFCYKDKEIVKRLRLDELEDTSRENIRKNTALCVFEILGFLLGGIE